MLYGVNALSPVFCSQSLTKTTAARRCPSPAARRMRPSSTAPSAPPTGSAPPPRPRLSPPRPAPPPRQTRAQRRASYEGAAPSLSLQGVDRPQNVPERQHWGAVASSLSLTHRGKGFSLSFSLGRTVFNLLWVGLFYVWSILSSVGNAVENAMFSLEWMKTEDQALYVYDVKHMVLKCFCTCVTYLLIVYFFI